ncbi:MAG: hypothetical protein R3F17_14190 [Planctomycetota bacterium]
MGLLALFGLIRRFTFDALWSGLEWLYPRVLAGALRMRLPLALVVLAGWGAWQRASTLGLSSPEIHQGEFTAFMTLKSVRRSRCPKAFGAMAEQVRGIEGVETTALTVGVEAETLTREIEGENTAD